MQRVYTNLAVLDVTPRGFVVRDMIPGLTFEALQARSAATLHREARTDDHRIEIRDRESLVGGAAFGASGAYTRLNGTAFGALDPAHPAQSRHRAAGQGAAQCARTVEYRSDFVILRPADPACGNGRILYEVNNRGRIMLFANLCAGTAGNTPQTAAELGNALPLRLGFTLVWSGWDAGAPKATGLSLDAPEASDAGKPIVRRIREEFVSGTRLGALTAFRLSHEAASRNATLTVRHSQNGPRQDVAFEFVDTRSLRLLPEETLPAPGSIYELHYDATKPRVQGIGFAATRDLISHLRRHGDECSAVP